MSQPVFPANLWDFWYKFDWYPIIYILMGYRYARSPPSVVSMGNERPPKFPLEMSDILHWKWTTPKIFNRNCYIQKRSFPLEMSDPQNFTRDWDFSGFHDLSNLNCTNFGQIWFCDWRFFSDIIKLNFGGLDFSGNSALHTLSSVNTSESPGEGEWCVCVVSSIQVICMYV